MPRKNASIAKITRPKLPEIFPRERLFRLLDDSRKKPVIWVSSPAGSGKTTLVASWLEKRKMPCIWYSVDAGDADLSSFFYYMGLAAKKAAPRYKKPLPLLTPEYLMGLSTFTKRWFENLFNRLKPPYNVVFDNCQDAAPESGLQDVLRDATSVIPAGMRVIVISRHEPPPAFARLAASDGMSVIGWESVRFTFEESKALVLARERLSDEAIRKLHEATGGWAAGLALMLGGAAHIPAGPEAEGGLLTEKVFDYFAGEVFDKLGRETRDFLLMASFLPKMTPETTAKLTDNNQAGRILSGLRRNHFFIEQHSAAEAVYQFHPLFRGFLLDRAKESLSRDGILRAQNRAAALLVETGQIEDAIALYCESSDWDQTIRLILGQAQRLVMQGRSRTLEGWLNRVPLAIFSGMPWLSFWLGACKLPFNPGDARVYFEKAFEAFMEAQDAAGLFLSWSGVIDSYIYEWKGLSQFDRWISELENLVKKFPLLPSAEIEAGVTRNAFAALFLRQPAHLELPLWEERLTSVMNKSSGNIRLMSGYYLMFYNVLIGNFAKADLIFGVVGRSEHSLNPADVIMARMIQAYYFWAKGALEQSVQAVNSALEAASASGIHIWSFTIASIGAYASLATDDRSAAEQYLKYMATFLKDSRTLDAAHYHYILAWDSMIKGEIGAAFEHGKACIDLNEQGSGPHFFSAFNHIAFSLVLYADAKIDDAFVHVEQARLIGREAKSALCEYRAQLVRAYFQIDSGGMQEGLQSLKDALSLGREKQFYNFEWWLPSVMNRLVVAALEHGIEVPYVQELIRRHRIVPDAAPLHVEHWPWPLMVYTLGRFEIVLNGKSVALLGKAQPKPLSMLKALIAFGGKDVSEARMTDALWPDAEGDVARRSFDTTLHRLRKLIGNDKAILISEGRLSLDDRRVWVDAWAFEKLIENAESGVQSNELGRREAGGARGKSEVRDSQSAIERAIALYRGHFLQADTRQSWTASMRERLRSKFLDIIEKAGTHCEQKGRYAKAIEWFRKGLAVDEYAEVFYQHLMVCYQKLGREADAVDAYKSCRSMLSKTLGVGPSSKTEGLYNALKIQP